MTRKYSFPDRAKHEARIMAFADKWVSRLDLDWVDITHVFSDQMHGEEGDSQDTTAAITNAIWEYRQAVITWFTPMVATMDNKRLEECVVHELCHVLLGPLKDHIKASAGGDKLEELATENVARALLATRKAGK